MKLLPALTSHLLTLPGVGRDQMESYADQGKLIPEGLDLGHGLQVGRFRYEAVISIDNCPASSADLLLATLSIWLGVYDPEREDKGLGEPDVDVSLLDDQTVFVELSVSFDEPIVVVPDPNGPLEYDGRKWRVDDAPVYVAENLAGVEAR